MITLLWAFLGIVGYIGLGAFFLVYRENTWMRLLPSHRRDRS